MCVNRLKIGQCHTGDRTAQIKTSSVQVMALTQLTGLQTPCDPGNSPSVSGTAEAGVGKVELQERVGEASGNQDRVVSPQLSEESGLSGVGTMRKQRFWKRAGS